MCSKTVGELNYLEFVDVDIGKGDFELVGFDAVMAIWCGAGRPSGLAPDQPPLKHLPRC